MSNYPKGSEWRRWDLHLHTKGTNKNDQFHASADFDAYCVTMLKKAVDKKIAAIGITDYFSIDNYKKVVDFIEKIDGRTDFDESEKEFIPPSENPGLSSPGMNDTTSTERALALA